MRGRWWSACAALLLLPGAARAQLAFFTGEERLGALYQLPGVEAGGLVEARLRVVNLGHEPVVLASFSIAGDAFSLAPPPELPRPLAPGAALEFTVRFEPVGPGNYSASLRAGDASLLVAALAVPAPQLYLDYGGAERLLAGAAEVDFGVVQRGAPASRKFLLRNAPGGQSALLRLSLEGAGFRFGAAQGSMLVEPGETARFEVLCDPLVSGPQRSVLRVGERRYTLRAEAVDPPLPPAELVVDLPSARSGQQGTVAVRLAARSETRATGRVTLVFQPASPEFSPDPAILFASGAATAAFSIEPGDSAARFGAKPYAEFQTGSTAGTITVVLELEGHDDRRSVAIPPAPVTIASAAVARGTNSVDVEVAGFDNTRTASRLAFTFYDRAGTPLPPGAIRADATDEFRRYFANTPMGGLFSMLARFPVMGDVAAIAAVEVEIVNGAGTARSARLKLP